jgi:iron complex outermembrane recepter protein
MNNTQGMQQSSPFGFQLVRAPPPAPANRSLLYVALCILTVVYAPDSFPQTKQVVQLEELTVTARRREELLQDVPISMTVFNQQQLDNDNIVTAADLATYTPSLSVNTRFGQDATVFQIRGFTQELRTTSSVGVYFAEVIAPRGANTSTSGDGAGPGDLFDLESVAVLKGPQGTLFGRNTTGGAVMLTPRRPTDEFEGHLEVSAGNYSMVRGRGVINVPVSDSIRLRFGVDRQKRDGHLDNVSGVGPDEFADIDYTALRVSGIIDITDSLENYTIVKSLNSDNDNVTSSIIACNPAGSFGSYCVDDLANRLAIGGDGFYDVWSNMEKPRSEIDQWQAINTTTWELNDKLTVKNIFSYAELETKYEAMFFGTNWQQLMANGTSQEIINSMAGLARGAKHTDSKTFVEEFQLLGMAFHHRLTWQAGIYYEKTEPRGDYGSQNASINSCDRSTIRDPNPDNWRCNDVLAARAKETFEGIGLPVPPQYQYLGSMTSSPGGVTYENKAIYVQGTFDLTDVWAATAGIRYTDDDTRGKVNETIAKFPGDIASGGYFAPELILNNTRKPESKSDEPTWLLGLDYKPNMDMLFYGKYGRGYRQGSVNLAGLPPLDVHKPEQVDTYELGAKTQFQGNLPVIVNVAVFYNDFQDQQLQMGYRNINGGGTTAIVNAGSSTIWGVEAEASVLLTENLKLSAAYTYLNTEVDELEFPELDPAAGDPSTVVVSTAEGESLPYTPENQAVVSASYLLPLDLSLGNITISGTWVYYDDQQTVSRESSPYYQIDSYDLLNLNLNWVGILGSPFDLSAFATNLTDEEYYTFISGTWGQGYESAQLGQPRMYGVRMKYNF